MSDISSDKSTINIYTDGSSRGNPGPGGCAAILKLGAKSKIISKGYKITTNNRMELMAIILALESIKSNSYNIIIYTDSKYIVNAINKGWLMKWIEIDFKKKKNKDLWLRFYKIYKKYNIDIKWVKGHNGLAENEACDKIAVEASKKHNLNLDLGYEKSIINI